VRRVGVRILDNEAVSVDGVRVIGIHDDEAAEPELLAKLLDQAGVKRGEPSILLTHQPGNLAIAEAAGVGLQVSGHTHGGQFWPWNLIVARIWGRFGYGLNRIGTMWVVTSSGVGTWGPPLRVGTRSEIVLVTFDRSTPTKSGS
jgi:predicted MPP superfamily phosphohydrolase